MGKYIIDCDEQSNVYRTYRDSLGRMFMQLVSKGGGMLPYTEPDTEQVRKEAYQRGYSAGKVDAYDEDAKKITKWIKKSEEAYQKGLDDAWEAARKIKNMSCYSRNEIFGTEFSDRVFERNTPSEAIEKIRQYEQEQEEENGEFIHCPKCGHKSCASDVWDNCEGMFCPNCGMDLKRPKTQLDLTAAVLRKMREEK